MIRPPDAASPIGDVQFDGERAALHFRRSLSHPPARVWAALTDPEELRLWYMATAAIEGRPGGSVDLVAGPAGFHVTGRILTWDPPRVYEHEWSVEPRAELPGGERSLVRWELALDSAGTALTLAHSGLTRPTALGFAPGTHALLDRLAALLDGVPLPDWGRRYAEVQAAYPALHPNGAPGRGSPERGSRQ